MKKLKINDCGVCHTKAKNVGGPSGGGDMCLIKCTNKKCGQTLGLKGDYQKLVEEWNKMNP